MPRRVDSLQAPAMAKPQIWVGNHDKRHGGCREATKQDRLQGAQHSGDLSQRYNWITKPSHYLWRVWTVQPSNRVTYQSSQHAFPALPCVNKSESETGRISQVPTTTIGHTTKPTDAGLCKMGLPRSTLMGKNAMEIIAPF